MVKIQGDTVIKCGFTDPITLSSTHDNRCPDSTSPERKNREVADGDERSSVRAAPSQDEMIDHGNLVQFANLDQIFRQGDVVFARRRIAARMVVRDDDRRPRQNGWQTRSSK